MARLRADGGGGARRTRPPRGPGRGRAAVFGYTLVNDWRARDADGDARETAEGLPIAIGPCIVTADELDPQTLFVQVRVDGEDWAKGNLNGAARRTCSALSATCLAVGALERRRRVRAGSVRRATGRSRHANCGPAPGRTRRRGYRDPAEPPRRPRADRRDRLSFFFAALRARRALGRLALLARPSCLRWRSFALRTLPRSPPPMSRSSCRVSLARRLRRRPAPARALRLRRGVDRVQERRAHARLLEMADRLDRRAAGRRHHLAELHRVLAGVAQHLRRTEHRLDDQLGRDVAREPQQDARLDHRLGEQEEVRGARAAGRRDRVEVHLLEPQHLARRTRAAPRRRPGASCGRVRAGADRPTSPRPPSPGRWT